MTTTSIAPPVRQQFLVGGVPLNGGLLFTYAAGTATKLATYTDYGGATPNTNPIVLDAQGQCDLWFTPGTRYKLALAPANDTDPPSNPYWVRDNLISADATVTTLAVDTFSGNSAQTAFVLSVTPTGKNNTLVYIAGVYQQKSTYSITGNVLSFTSPPATGTNNIEVETINQADYAFVSTVVNTVAANMASVQTVATNIAGVNSAAANITAINAAAGNASAAATSATQAAASQQRVKTIRNLIMQGGI